jgi:hypothetical protein
MITTYIISDLMPKSSKLESRNSVFGFVLPNLLLAFAAVIIDRLVHQCTRRDGRMRLTCFEEAPLVQCFDMYVFLGLTTTRYLHVQ